MCRYSWIRKTTPRTTVLLATPTPARAGAVTVNGPSPRVRRRGAGLCATLAPTTSTTPGGWSAARGSPPDRGDRDRSACRRPRAAAGARPDDDRRPNRRTSRQSARPAGRVRLHLRAARGRRDRAARCAPHISLSRRIPVTASCGCAREAPPTRLSDQIRQIARGGPCGAAQTRWRARHGYACAAESHAPAPGVGCSAGRSACPWPRRSPRSVSLEACPRHPAVHVWLS